MVKTRKACDGMSAAEKIKLKPIDFVKTKTVGKEVKDRGNVSEIVLREDLAEALDVLQAYLLPRLRRCSG